MKNKFLTLTSTALILSASLYAIDMDDIVIATKHNKHMTLEDIAEIQPGLGTIMMEFGHRFYIVYYAAKAGNWGLAEYELHELIEAQEVAETTRPKYKQQLKKFEDNYLEDLEDSIEDKNFTKFKQEYNKVTEGCNDCHTLNGHPYIKYQLPTKAPKYLRMAL